MSSYTKRDFLSTTNPYAELLATEKDPKSYAKSLAEIKDNAHNVGVKNFDKLYRQYVDSLA